MAQMSHASRNEGLRAMQARRLLGSLKSQHFCGDTCTVYHLAWAEATAFNGAIYGRHICGSDKVWLNVPSVDEGRRCIRSGRAC